MDISRKTDLDCQNCETHVRFELFGHKMPEGLSIDLSTVPVCLSLAEQAGHIPPLPTEWWIETKGHLQLAIPSLDTLPIEDSPHGCIQTKAR